MGASHVVLPVSPLPPPRGLWVAATGLLHSEARALRPHLIAPYGPSRSPRRVVSPGGSSRSARLSQLLPQGDPSGVRSLQGSRVGSTTEPATTHRWPIERPYSVAPPRAAVPRQCPGPRMCRRGPAGQLRCQGLGLYSARSFVLRADPRIRGTVAVPPRSRYLPLLGPRSGPTACAGLVRGAFVLLHLPTFGVNME